MDGRGGARFGQGEARRRSGRPACPAGHRTGTAPGLSRLRAGRLPPVGSLLGAPLYVDQEVLQHETVVFAAGSQTESVQLKTADLLQHEKATLLPLIKQADENDKDWLR
jgi:aminoacyl-tRNA editing protein